MLIIEIIHLSIKHVPPSLFLLLFFWWSIFFIFPFPHCFIQFFELSYVFPSPLFILKRTIFFFKPTRSRFHSFWTVNNQLKKRTKPKKYNLQLCWKYCNRFKFCVFSLLPFSLYNILVSNYIFIAKRDFGMCESNSSLSLSSIIRTVPHSQLSFCAAFF